MKLISDVKCFNGRQKQYTHHSVFNKTEMQFSIFLPPQALMKKVPVLYWLSDMGCTDENFVQRAGAQRYAAEHGVAIVSCDTSPRGVNVPVDPKGAIDLGIGAGFYVTAIQKPWERYFHMYEYIVSELPALIKANFSVDSRKQSIFGHSMGGHGALTIALKNPDKYVSVSAFAPICSPMNCPWGVKALTNYIGTNKEEWQQHDTCSLIAKASGKKFELLVDQGLADNFLLEQLKPSLLKDACTKNSYPLELRFQQGYDHSYNFVSSFIGDHIAFHAKRLAV